MSAQACLRTNKRIHQFFQAQIEHDVKAIGQIGITRGQPHGLQGPHEVAVRATGPVFRFPGRMQQIAVDQFQVRIKQKSGGVVDQIPGAVHAGAADLPLANGQVGNASLLTPGTPQAVRAVISQSLMAAKELLIPPMPGTGAATETTRLPGSRTTAQPPPGRLNRVHPVRGYPGGIQLEILVPAPADDHRNIGGIIDAHPGPAIVPGARNHLVIKIVGDRG